MYFPEDYVGDRGNAEGVTQDQILANITNIDFYTVLFGAHLGFGNLDE